MSYDQNAFTSIWEISLCCYSCRDHPAFGATSCRLTWIWWTVNRPRLSPALLVALMGSASLKITRPHGPFRVLFPFRPSSGKVCGTESLVRSTSGDYAWDLLLHTYITPQVSSSNRRLPQHTTIHCGPTKRRI
jgi:hypothetical protein